MEDIEELSTNMNYIFSNDRCITHTINDNLYQYDYIKVFVLCLAYLHLCNVPKKVLELCLDCEIDEKEFEFTYNFLADKWEQNAKEEIDEIIYEIENGEDF